MGSAGFLRERLIACTPEEFLSRPDVFWIMSDGSVRELEDLQWDDGDSDGDNDSEWDADESDGDDEPDELDVGVAFLEPLSGLLENAVREWCVANGAVPHPQLRAAAAVLLATVLPIAVEDMGQGRCDNPEGASREIAVAALQSFSPDDRDGIVEAGAQIGQFMRQFKTTQAMIEAVKLEF